MAITAPPRGANPFDAGGVEADEHGVRRFANLHGSLLEMLRAGTIRPAIHERVPLAEAARAHTLLESGAVMGRLLLRP